jgi:predicted dehydrogenase
MTMALTGGGAELAGYHSDNPDAAAGFDALFDRPARFESVGAVLDDDTVDLIVPVGVPAERADVAIAAMDAGKDVLADKPALTTSVQLDALRATQAATGRIFSVWFSERFESRATARASQLVADGAVGQVVQVVGAGPHRLGLESRPAWFLDPERAGGILNDLASHQIDQILHFAGHGHAADADMEIVSSMVANRAHPDQPQFEDYGEVHLRSASVSGMARVDWFTPDGLPTWGDVRLFVLGTEGYIEVRKNVDIAGRDGGDHLLLVDGSETRHFDCRQGPLPFIDRFLDDVRTRGSTLMSQEHCFTVCELALRAQTEAARMGHLSEG